MLGFVVMVWNFDSPSEAEQASQKGESSSSNWSWENHKSYKIQINK